MPKDSTLSNLYSNASWPSTMLPIQGPISCVLQKCNSVLGLYGGYGKLVDSDRQNSRPTFSVSANESQKRNLRPTRVRVSISWNGYPCMLAAITTRETSEVARPPCQKNDIQASLRVFGAYVTETSDRSAWVSPAVFDLFTIALSVHAWNSFALMTASDTGPAASYVVAYCSPIVCVFRRNKEGWVPLRHRGRGEVVGESTRTKTHHHWSGREHQRRFTEGT